MNHRYELADFGEPIEIDNTYRVIVFRHGRRVKYLFERLPIMVKHAEKHVDFSCSDGQTKGQTT